MSAFDLQTLHIIWVFCLKDTLTLKCAGGMIPGADPQKNSEIGTLKHDAWTYWGHSGAPLLLEEDGTLIGLHSSWDDQTTMRRKLSFQSFLVLLRLLPGSQDMLRKQSHF